MASNFEDIRGITLDVVMQRMGAEPDPTDPRRNWLHPAGRITVTENKFYNHTQGKGGGGAIDLTMHLGEMNFKQAISFLSQEFGKEDVLRQYQAEAKRRVEEMAKTPIPQATIPAPEPSKLKQVVDYLTKKRGLPQEILNKHIDAKNLWADRYGNCVFPMRDATGKTIAVELRGTYDKPFHGTRGDKSNAFFFAGTTTGKKIAYVESGIDALSFEALRPGYLVASTNGSRREAVVEHAKRLLVKGYEVYAAFDADKAGDSLSKNIAEDLSGKCKRDRPTSGKDWNEQLKARGQGKTQSAKGQDIEKER